MAGHDVFKYECSQKSKADSMTTNITLDKEKVIKCGPGLFFQQTLFDAPPNLLYMGEFLSFALATFFSAHVRSCKFFSKGK